MVGGDDGNKQKNMKPGCNDDDYMKCYHNNK